MTRIELDMPKVCSKCGFFNFNVSGCSYNRDFNYTIIRITCMRCGNPEREIKVDNNKAEKIVLQTSLHKGS